MGANKQRIKQTVADEFEPYLLDFEERVLDNIDDRLTKRLDTLNGREEQLIRSARDINNSSDRLRRQLKSFSTDIAIQLVGWSFVSAMVGGLTTFLLLWYFW